jgi:large subunit ribosomal protein L10
LALSKQHKEEVLAKYKDWLSKSQAVILVEYTGVTMKDMDSIRARLRESGGEFHVVKNTLVKLAFQAGGFPIPEGLFEKSTAVGFAFSDVTSTIKTLSDATKNIAAIKVKCGFVGTEMYNPAQVKALADLPPMPVLRGQLLGVLQAPASKLARILAEPGRQVAAVLKAYSEKSAAPAAA